MKRSRFFEFALVFSAIMASALNAYAQPSFIAFESGSVRPMAMSPAGDRLFVTNTPDHRLEVFAIDDDGTLTPTASVPVGMDPVAVAARSASEVWVVNHLSDSVNIVDLSGTPPTVTRTLLVGDEPRDIVFAQGRAFITTAHRGQHRTHPSIAAVPGAGDPQLHVAGVPRADVWVFDPANLGAALGGVPLKIVELFGDTPRGLAVSADGNTVFAAVFHSGNRTSVVHEGVMCRGFEDSVAGADEANSTGEARAGNEPCIVGNIPAADASFSPNGPMDKTLPSGRPLPSTGADGELQPWLSMIVKFDPASGEWRDSRGLNFSNGIRFFLPDYDVFAIDATTLNPTDRFSGVGTTLFNLAVNPQNGLLYVSNTEAQNHVRFEGPGIRGGSTVQGNIAQVRITVIDPATGAVKPRHLNRHIDYQMLKAPPGVKAHSLALPLEMQMSSDGSRLYVAAMGSDRVAVLRTADLENDALWDGTPPEFNPLAASEHYIDVAGGPAGILLDEAHNRPNGQLYVLTRFDNRVNVLDAMNGTARQVIAMHNPEPPQVQAGRFMLYDAKRTSSNGESSCASCHIFGDMDHLSWNLGNPDAGNTRNPQPFPTRHFATLGCDLVGPDEASCLSAMLINGNGDIDAFASMKGPMSTQTMRGMSTHGHMHWRGDRAHGYFGIDTAQTLDETLSFKNFIVAFEGLLGLDIELPASVNAPDKSPDVIALEQDMERFAAFMLSVQLPPNPLRPLDNSLRASAQIGQDFFNGSRRADGIDVDIDVNGPEPDGATCQGCHTHNPALGFFGTDGQAAHGGEILVTKVPHFRNLYQKVGMFGLPHREGFLPSTTDAHQGDQIRGFGFLHDGATDKLFNFLQGGVFDDGDTTCADQGLGDHFGCGVNDGMHVGIPDDTVRQGLVDYLLAFDSDLAPIVGQQMTLSPDATADALDRIALLETRAATPFASHILRSLENANLTECDLVVKGVIDGLARGLLYDPDTETYRSDRLSEAALTPAEIRALPTTSGEALTFTCFPPGSGQRAALDRDQDRHFDRDERDAGSDPHDPTSIPPGSP